MELTPETLLNNRYRIIRQLGKGGMGSVYLAFDTALEHQVAIKTNLNPAAHSTTQFLREARLLANLRHPNLPRVIDYFVNGQEQYLVMDYIPGDDLGSLLSKEGPQPVEKVLGWAQQLGSALSYLHRQNPSVIHRDIKPSNIKLTNEGEVVLVDFGIAKSSDSSQATATGAIGYTPGYAPPEQYGSSRTGPYSDQYAFAATLYCLLTGQKPVESVERVLGSSVLTPMGILNPMIPANIQQAIEKALSVRPEDRFASVDDFMRSLNDPSFQVTVLKQDTTVVAKPTPKAAPRRKLPAWVWFAGGGALVIVLVILAGAAGIGYYLFNKGARAATPTSIALVSGQETPQPTEAPLPTVPAPSETATSIPTAQPTATIAPTATPENTATVTPAALGKGGLIAFASDRADGITFQIWTMKAVLDVSGQAQAGDFTQVTTSEGNKSQPAWSPDGTRLLFVAAGGNDTSGRDTGLAIWELDLSRPGSDPFILINLKGDDTDPAWSPDGKVIAFTNKGRFNDIRQIYMINADATNLRRISFDYEEYHPVWSPDMAWLLYIIFGGDHHYMYLRSSKYDFSTATPQAYDNKQLFGRQGEVFGAAWSPDGATIAYTRIDGLRESIYSIPFKSRGDSPSLLTKDTVRDMDPAWSPDSQWIVFTTERDHNPEIYVMTSTGLLQTNLTNNPARDIQPAWQP
jgi:serine/threonine protein kinase/Tol biopolymer transport system component